jgi:arylsulfatase A-like enzyme
MGSQGEKPKTKQVPWDESICVPFLIKVPGLCGTKGRVIETPLNTTDILPTLLSLAQIEIPNTVEGEDISSHIVEEQKCDDRAVLFMSVAPFAGVTAKGYRGIRNIRYTYVRDYDGPWLLYDNKEDPYQMNNLIDEADKLGLKEDLESQLQTLLDKNEDPFLSKEESIKLWGYNVIGHGEIPYFGNFETQSPAFRKK